VTPEEFAAILDRMATGTTTFQDARCLATEVWEGQEGPFALAALEWMRRNNVRWEM
jgi:hypothetical protein